MAVLITPSILSANFATLQAEIDAVEPYSDWLQVDVMDGHFVPNLSFGAPVLKWVKTKLPLDVHLMVSNPADRIDEFLALNVSNITFHAEVTSEKERKEIISRIRKNGKATAGIALNPDTGLHVIDDVIDTIDVVLIMSVNPGFGGQEFISIVLEKVRALKATHPKLMVQIDGGINRATAKLAREAGVDNIVAGSAIFGAQDRKAAIEELRGK